jgi:hypothetical protein
LEEEEEELQELKIGTAADVVVVMIGMSLCDPA